MNPNFEIFRVNADLLAELRGVVDFFFSTGRDDLVTLAVAAQDEINRRHFVDRLADCEMPRLRRVLTTEKVLIQSNAYLRAVPPGRDSIGWHRESFYGDSMQTCVNFWMPIAGVNFDSALLYIPGSEAIADSDIKTESEIGGVARFSREHKLGKLYAPKKIVAGVDFSAPKPFVVLPGEGLIFPGALIHGAGANHSSQIRFSLDFRAIAAENYHASKPHFASGKDYFIPA